MPLSTTLILASPVVEPRHLDANRAAFGEFDGVARQIEHDLADANRVSLMTRGSAAS